MLPEKLFRNSKSGLQFPVPHCSCDLRPFSLYTISRHPALGNSFSVHSVNLRPLSTLLYTFSLAESLKTQSITSGTPTLFPQIRSDCFSEACLLHATLKTVHRHNLISSPWRLALRVCYGFPDDYHQETHCGYSRNSLRTFLRTRCRNILRIPRRPPEIRYENSWRLGTSCKPGTICYAKL